VQNLLSPAELNTLSEQFRRFDKNKNGRLSRDELIEGFREVRGIDFSEKEIDDLIKRVDVDGSGDIDFLQSCIFQRFGCKMGFLNNHKIGNPSRTWKIQNI
jgi:Ca2+-binding EF-hand superfamily protein